MKIIKSVDSKQYIKYTDTNWSSPEMTSNEEDTFSVSAQNQSGENFGTPWTAFSNKDNYLSYYRDETRASVYIYIQDSAGPLCINSFSAYFKKLGDSSKGSLRFCRLYGSDYKVLCSGHDDAASVKTWIPLCGEDSIVRDTDYSWDFYNKTFYNYYLIEVSTWGSSYSDQLTIGNISLKGLKRIETVGTPTDYTKVIESSKYYLKNISDKRYAFK